MSPFVLSPSARLRTGVAKRSRRTQFWLGRIGPRACLLALVGVIFWTGLAHAWTSAQPGYVWSFPRDHWARDGYKTEWWYFTGHLRVAEEPVPRFGFQFTFFRIGVSPDASGGDSAWAANSIIMGHAAVTDLETGRHRFSELVVRAAPLLAGFGRHPDPRIAWSVGPPGTPDEWQLRWNGKGFDFTMADAGKSFGFSLSTRPLKPLVFQGPGGLSRKGEGATEASHYYSFTRMATTGTVRLEGKEWEVSGTSWMDKEFGSNQLGEDTEGWDWFSLQFDDGREVMLYLLRNRNGGTHYAGATLVEAGGAVRHLQPSEWKLNATGQWTSPATGAPYPAGWILDIPDAAIRAVITPRLADQENRSSLIPNLFYWEGSVRVESGSGTRIGQGYVELTGHGENSRPPI
ncbi:MAG: carotenoid 1,2-hydratase [Deltaproteobacteria bacterium]|nr:carotenoid 1,2-hydratase [Deltaproteobacteria bacterium]